MSEISQDGSYVIYSGIGVLIGGVYSVITLAANAEISPAIRSAIRNYINSLEERASHR